MHFFTTLFKLPIKVLRLIRRTFAHHPPNPEHSNHPEQILALLGPSLAEAEVFLDMGSEGEAREVIEAFLLEHPGHEEAVKLLTRINDLTALRHGAPDTFPDGLNEASLHVLHGHYPQARTLVKDFLLTDPANEHAMRLLQRIRELQTEKMAGEVDTYLRFGRHAQAKKVIEDYLRQYPDDGYAMHLMVKALRGLNK